MRADHPADRGAHRSTLAVLDDHQVVLDGLVSWVEANAPDLVVAVRATTWLELVRSPRFPVELVLMDYQLAEPVSIESRVRTCRAAGAAVVVVSALDSREARTRAIDAGAAAFIPKSQPGTRVLAVVRRVLARLSSGAVGTADRDRVTEDGVVTYAHWMGVSEVEAASALEASGAPAPSLSAAELTALRLYVGGRTTADVADEMGVSYETVKTYLRRVREKYARLGRSASRKGDLTRRAAEDGFLE
ncbi:helix-turn-helix transcriptional regulator [Agromyces sp. SYSU T00194]|uniref:helix-turn-helix transcriptional regulator n=1 Tax=Agromyces chitinivorans TaxID=3158560 RepID=UPI00339506BA